MLSNSQIDKIGHNLKAGAIDAGCLRDLELFRSSFVNAYTSVEDILVETLGHKITGRPSKSTVAIVEKLKRETIRLSQIQDIAGCRILTSDLVSQDNIVEVMQIMLGDVDIDDKRLNPTNGYRAVHVIVKKVGRPVEVQVRTRLQHAWADISEKISDAFGQSIKYGVGVEWALLFLSDLSDATARLEVIRHNKLDISIRKRQSGRSHAMVIENKKLNDSERKCMREIRKLFDGIKQR